MKLFTCLLGTILLCSCGEDPYLLSFHMQADPTDGSKFAFQNTDGLYYSKASFLSKKDLVSYYSFPASNNTYGVVFNISGPMAHRVEGITAENLGKQILPMVNGHTMTPMRLYNRPISSGRLAILDGFSPADLAELAKHIPPADKKREEAINKMATRTKPLLRFNDPTNEQKKIRQPDEDSNTTVISTHRGRI